MENKVNDKRRNRILFDFESIIDLKLSVIRRKISEETGYPIQDFELSRYKRLRMFSIRNILEGIEYNEDDFYHPKYPVFTSMKRLIERLQKEGSGIVDPVVLCKDQIQQRIIKESIPNVKTLVGTRDKVKSLRFARIVLSDPNHALEFINPTTVDFMILNYRENFMESDDKMINPKILSLIGDVNTFTIAKAYPEIKDPVG